MQIEGYSWKKLRPAPTMMSPNPYRKSSPLSRRTEGSNPPSSSGESRANLISSNLPPSPVRRLRTAIEHRATVRNELLVFRGKILGCPQGGTAMKYLSSIAK
jgi:hypothetical protein